MSYTRLDRQVNGTLMHKKEFQAAIIEAIRDGNVWPAEVARLLGWDGTSKERTAITNDIQQLVRLGLLQAPAGYTVTEKGQQFVETYSKPTEVAPVTQPAAIMPAGPLRPPTVNSHGFAQTPKPIHPVTPVRTVMSPVRPAAPAPQRPVPPTPVRPTAPQPIRARRF